MKSYKQIVAEILRASSIPVKCITWAPQLLRRCVRGARKTFISFPNTIDKWGCLRLPSSRVDWAYNWRRDTTKSVKNIYTKLIIVKEENSEYFSWYGQEGLDVYPQPVQACSDVDDIARHCTTQWKTVPKEKFRTVLYSHLSSTILERGLIFLWTLELLQPISLNLLVNHRPNELSIFASSWKFPAEDI